MKPKSSTLDTRGNWFVDCAECKRGGKGDQSCSSGGNMKKIRQGGCFSGALLPKFQEENNE